MIVQAIQLFFTPEVLIACIIGVIGGITVGALPGLSASMAVALLIPITFKMSPAAGLVLLVSVYTAAIYGGSITAVLIHTPGTPSSAATALDGYEMTKKGKGLKAIGIVTIASMLGGTFSALALLFIAPKLAQISLKFTSLEYFFIAVFGLTIIGSLAGKSMVKGLMSGMFGLLVGCIGLDIMNGTPRFTMGIINLESGISLVPAMIGMFSISQVLISVEEIRKGKTRILDEGVSGLQGKMIPTKAEFLKIFPTILRSSVIGTIVGILPGAGSDIGSWVSYNNAKQFSRTPEEFGNGSMEGIAAAEAANNAVTGGALIPLLTLGIPGSGVTAIMLGGLMIKGLVPGHKLFTESGNITYAIIIGFLVANILMGIIGLLIAKQVVKVSVVPMTILCPIIIGLSTVGAYAINNSIFDIYIMIVGGIIGYFMRKIGFATAPIILGLILGPLAEQNFRQSLVLSRGNMFGYFLSRPISIFLAVLVIISLFSPIIMKTFSKNTTESTPADTAKI
ncbi:putative tricarboxylic transport membrane protein [Anaerovirgula multivorans]|uniref:Putative tricarboxylic transport membrane protein n=1 Tax=Anaerovirgula multivorans TaxID=312168 RepID=A0A239L414_9FIRM|nr:tripartite tricarboxylate transporter permease [Anaerovirgula multivorans]SNT25337.1 putative tricarboxylic transport membrane protein [Anaerovirgula multivorans]